MIRFSFLEQAWHVTCHSVSETETALLLFVGGIPFEQCQFDNSKATEVITHYEKQAELIANPDLKTMYLTAAYAVNETMI